MNKIQIRSLVITIMAVLIAYLLSLAIAPYSVQLGSFSLYALLGVLAFVIQWIAFVPAYKFQTEHYYDLTGSLTYLSVIVFAFIFSGARENPRAALLCALIIIWTIRLGAFLFLRIRKDGKDSRFDEIMPFWYRFLAAWTLQGLWVFVTLAAALAVITSRKDVPLGIFAYVGFAVWLFGFVVEVVADNQKSKFKKNVANKGRFITTGLWSWSRHPNYFGEIVLWCGVFIICIPVLEDWQWLSLISPVFVFLLLTRISGVNMLEAIADKRWGGEEAYENYKENTSILLLRPPAK